MNADIYLALLVASFSTLGLLTVLVSSLGIIKTSSAHSISQLIQPGWLTLAMTAVLLAAATLFGVNEMPMMALAFASTAILYAVLYTYLNIKARNAYRLAAYP